VYETYDCRFILHLKCNQALWRARGVTAGRHSQIKCSIPNPIYVDEQVSLFADVPHLFKNIKAMLVPNKVITLPDNIVSQHSLPSNEVRVSHINELVAHQEKHAFKLAPKLSGKDIFPGHFSQMKVMTKSWPVTAPGSQGVFRGRGRG
jgi:hypothetical protein